MRVCNQIEPLSIRSDQFTPLSDQMLIKYIEESESDGGILYATPDNTWWADVIRTGPLCSVRAGDKVLMMEFRGENINMSDGEFTIVNEKNALMVEDAA